MHRHPEFIRFLNLIEARGSKKKTIHVIDNYATHKHPDVLEWLQKHRQFVFHFTPTSASWPNAIEGLFATLAKKRLKRGVFRSLRELNMSGPLVARVLEARASLVGGLGAGVGVSVCREVLVPVVIAT
jgi:transposase